MWPISLEEDACGSFAVDQVDWVISKTSELGIMESIGHKVKAVALWPNGLTGWDILSVSSTQIRSRSYKYGLQWWSL